MVEKILEFLAKDEFLYIITILGLSFGIMSAFIKIVNAKRRFIISILSAFVVGILFYYLGDLSTIYLVAVGILTASFYGFLIKPLVKVLGLIENSADGKTLNTVLKLKKETQYKKDHFNKKQYK